LQSIYASSSDDDKTNNRSLGKKKRENRKIAYQTQKKNIDWLNRQIFLFSNCEWLETIHDNTKKDILFSLLHFNCHLNTHPFSLLKHVYVTFLWAILDNE